MTDAHLDVGRGEDVRRQLGGAGVGVGAGTSGGGVVRLPDGAVQLRRPAAHREVAQLVHELHHDLVTRGRCYQRGGNDIQEDYRHFTGYYLILNSSWHVTAFVCSFVRFRSLRPGGNVLLPHFSRRVLYRWLYSLWKSVMWWAILRSYSQTINARLQQTTAHSESRLTRGRESTHRLVQLRPGHNNCIYDVFV